MAEGQLSSNGQALPKINYVADDQIWKDHVHHEIDSAKSWPANWDFMTTKYEDLVKDDFPDRSGEKKKFLPPTPMRIPPVTPIENRVQVLPNKEPLPKCTSKMIGWRSSHPELKLERYGGYAKPRGGLIKQLNWPAEAID